MAAMYGGARWASATSALPEDEQGRLTLAADTWAQALAGVTEEQIAEGLRACLASNDEYVPTAMLFRARCLGIPSLAHVQHALTGRSSVVTSPFVRLVWQRLDAHALARADQQGADRMIGRAYSWASDHVMRGGSLPAEPAALVEHVNQPRVPASAETAIQALSAIAATLGIQGGDAVDPAKVQS